MYKLKILYISNHFPIQKTESEQAEITDFSKKRMYRMRILSINYSIGGKCIIQVLRMMKKMYARLEASSHINF